MGSSMQPHSDSRQARHRTGSLRVLARRFFAPVTISVGVVLCGVALGRMLSLQSIHIAADPARLLVVSVLVATNMFVAALAWRAFLRGFCQRLINWRDAVSQVGLVLVGKYVPGKISGIAARVVANTPACSARSVTVATIFEQLGSMAMAGILGCAAYIAPDAPLAALVLLLLTIVSCCIGGNVVRWLLLRWPRFSRLVQVANMEPKSVSHAFSLQGLQWLGLSVMVVLVAQMVTSGQHFLALLQVAGAYGMAVVVGQLAIVFPGGIGPREGAFVWIAGNIIPSSEALALALVLRIVTSGMDLLAGLAYVIFRWRGPT